MYNFICFNGYFSTLVSESLSKSKLFITTISLCSCCLILTKGSNSAFSNTPTYFVGENDAS